MGKSIFTFFVFMPISFIGFLIGWISFDLKTGFIVGLGITAFSILASSIVFLFSKGVSLFEVFLPIPIAILWSIILMPFSLGVQAFSVPTLMTSALLLTAALWIARSRPTSSRVWLLYPVLAFIYEMLPVNFPTLIDDIFATTGDALWVLLQYANNKNPMQIPENSEKLITNGNSNESA